MRIYYGDIYIYVIIMYESIHLFSAPTLLAKQNKLFYKNMVYLFNFSSIPLISIPKLVKDWQFFKLAATLIFQSKISHFAEI